MNKKLIAISVLSAVIAAAILLFALNGRDNRSSDSRTENEQTVDGTSSKDNRKDKITDNFTKKLNISINGTDYAVTVEDNETVREFVKKLPMEITMEELNGNEKYYYLDSSLPNNPAKIGKINAGDLMLYGGNCLVLFYDSFDSSYSYTKIGHVDNPSSLKQIVGTDSIKVSISK